MNKKVTLPMILKNFERITDESARQLAGKLLDYAEICINNLEYKQAEKVLKPIRARFKNNPGWLNMDDIVNWDIYTKLMYLEEEVKQTKAD